MIRNTFICVFVLSLLLIGSNSEKLVNGTCPSSMKTDCVDGVIIPMWLPSSGITACDRAARAIVYFASLMYLFLGVSIIADRFMAAIEVITSQEKEVTVKKKTGESYTISVRIWNETVSNLTLMALGSSAPEIMLSVIEIIGKNFEAGDLGPGTIVGSAAFNLFVIIGVCIMVIPDGQVRRIKHLSVFFITSSWSVFAYLWMYIIIAISTPGEVEIWEALLTFIFFPVIVLCAYAADTKIFFKKFLRKKYHAKRTMKTANGDLELANHTDDVVYLPETDDKDSESEFDRHRMDYVEAIKEIRKRNPNIGMKELEELAQLEVLNKGPKSRAYYRMQATRQLTGSGNVIKKAKVERKLSIDDSHLPDESYLPTTQRIHFDPGHYTVMENIGKVSVFVRRVAENMNCKVSVQYKTVDGTAHAGSDYEAVSGELVFESNETEKTIQVAIVDDDIFEEDEHFTVELNSPYVVEGTPEMDAVLVTPSSATVMILDDDHSGVFGFECEEMSVSESAQCIEIVVQRVSGCRGVVKLPYQTEEGTAKGGGKDYEDKSGYLIFNNDETESVIRINVIDDNDYEKSEHFFLQLGEPILLDKEDLNEEGHPNLLSRFSQRLGSMDKRGSIFEQLHHHQQEPVPQPDQTKSDPDADMGKPRLGNNTRLKITIKESAEFKSTVDRLVKHGQWALVIGTSSWKEQFIEAITVSAGDEGGGEDDEEVKLPTCMDYVMHFLTVFWKVLFAFVPPTDYGGGWYCFTVCIIVIGALTAIIGDVASSFGCSVGLTDSVTAITFVALGTSLPDTFASKVAAIGDEYADSSIGNVTGSNAVNVFLGIGVAWSIAAIYHAANGTKFVVKPGSLGFSVTIFCIFALMAITLILFRRRRSIGGELGGPKLPKYLSAFFLIFLWLFYVLLSALENYCLIEGF